MIDTTTNYLGMPLRSPIVASASPLCDSIDNMHRMEESGIAAVVIPPACFERANYMRVLSFVYSSVSERGVKRRAKVFALHVREQK